MDIKKGAERGREGSEVLQRGEKFVFRWTSRKEQKGGGEDQRCCSTEKGLYLDGHQKRSRKG